MNKPEGLDDRRKELRAKLRLDPSAPEQPPQWTHKEMRDAAQRLMTSVLKTGKIVS